jgi:hypothetical protein
MLKINVKNDIIRRNHLPNRLLYIEIRETRFGTEYEDHIPVDG